MKQETQIKKFTSQKEIDKFLEEGSFKIFSVDGFTVTYLNKVIDGKIIETKEQERAAMLKLDKRKEIFAKYSDSDQRNFAMAFILEIYNVLTDEQKAAMNPHVVQMGQQAVMDIQEIINRPIETQDDGTTN